MKTLNKERSKKFRDSILFDCDMFISCLKMYLKKLMVRTKK